MDLVVRGYSLCDVVWYRTSKSYTAYKEMPEISLRTKWPYCTSDDVCLEVSMSLKLLHFHETVQTGSAYCAVGQVQMKRTANVTAVLLLSFSLLGDVCITISSSSGSNSNSSSSWSSSGNTTTIFNTIITITNVIITPWVKLLKAQNKKNQAGIQGADEAQARCRWETSRLNFIYYSRWQQIPVRKKAGPEHVRQKLYLKRNDSRAGVGGGVGGGGGG